MHNSNASAPHAAGNPATSTCARTFEIDTANGPVRRPVTTVVPQAATRAPGANRASNNPLNEQCELTITACPASSGASASITARCPNPGTATNTASAPRTAAPTLPATSTVHSPATSPAPAITPDPATKLRPHSETLCPARTSTAALPSPTAPDPNTATRITPSAKASISPP